MHLSFLAESHGREFGESTLFELLCGKIKSNITICVK